MCDYDTAKENSKIQEKAIMKKYLGLKLILYNISQKILQKKNNFVLKLKNYAKNNFKKIKVNKNINYSPIINFPNAEKYSKKSDNDLDYSSFFSKGDNFSNNLYTNNSVNNSDYIEESDKNSQKICNTINMTIYNQKSKDISENYQDSPNYSNVYKEKINTIEKVSSKKNYENNKFNLIGKTVYSKLMNSLHKYK